MTFEERQEKIAKAVEQWILDEFNIHLREEQRESLANKIYEAL